MKYVILFVFLLEAFGVSQASLAARDNLVPRGSPKGSSKSAPTTPRQSTASGSIAPPPGFEDVQRPGSANTRPLRKSLSDIGLRASDTSKAYATRRMAEFTQKQAINKEKQYKTLDNSVLERNSKTMQLPTRMFRNAVDVRTAGEQAGQQWAFQAKAARFAANAAHSAGKPTPSVGSDSAIQYANAKSKVLRTEAQNKMQWAVIHHGRAIALEAARVGSFDEANAMAFLHKQAFNAGSHLDKDAEDAKRDFDRQFPQG